MNRKKHETFKGTENINYNNYLIIPLQLVGCWDWYRHPKSEYQAIINLLYSSFVIFVLINLQISLIVHLYIEWTDAMSSLMELGDELTLFVAFCIVIYFVIHKDECYELVDFMNDNFKYNSARGLTNTDMLSSYTNAKMFGNFYTAFALFSISVYVTMPLIKYVISGQPIQLSWVYADVSTVPHFIVAFFQICIGQIFVGLSFGQLGVFLASNLILLGGQLDLLSCSVRNSRYTALLMAGVRHQDIASQNQDFVLDEIHGYVYNQAVLYDSEYHYDKKMTKMNVTTEFDIYNTRYDAETIAALKECAKMSGIIVAYKKKLEAFISPLLVLRVVQVTVYLCTLLYVASSKLDMVSIEYIVAVSLDIYIYCYYGNQVILQADRVSTAAYQSAWHTMGADPRRMLINIMLEKRRPFSVRAGNFLPLDLRTFLVIMKTSFSYYTLLVNVNDR